MSETATTKRRKSRGGRPQHQRDEARASEIALFLGTGCKLEAVAYNMKISVNTLKKHYPNEVAMGRDLNELFWVSSLAAAARGGSVEAIKFALSRKFGWTERHNLAFLDGEDGIIFDSCRAPVSNTTTASCREET